MGVRQAASPLPLPPWLIGAAALLSAVTVGAALAVKPPAGLAMVVALIYTPLVLLNLPLGIACWVALAFIEDLSFVSVAPLAASILVVLAWIGTLRDPAAASRRLLREQRRLIGLVGALLAWVFLSIGWSRQPHLGGQLVGPWITAGLVFVILATSLPRPKHARMVALAFVIGAVISVVIGLVDNGINSPPGATAIDAAGRANTRLSGGSADPNFLAAGIVPAVVLAAGLIASSRNFLLRVALVGASGVLVVGFAAAQSRGSLVASGIAVIAGLLFSGRGRLPVAAFIAFIVGVAAVSFALNPTAWHRITHINSEGNGRGDLWHVAWQISEDHPAIGVGLNNFIDRSADYTRRPGELKFVDLIAERPHVVHNAYLQMLAETGVVGLSLFVFTLLGCFRCAWRAAKRFEAVQDSAMATLSRATLIAAIAGWSSSFFLSNATDPRMWVLLGLALALLAMARQEEALVGPLERPAPPVVAAAA